MACAGCKKKRGKKTQEPTPLVAPREEVVEQQSSTPESTNSTSNTTSSPSFQSPKVLKPISR